MRQFAILAALAAGIASQSAVAADMPVAPAYKAPPPAVLYNWTGFYMGLHGGYGSGEGSSLGATADIDGWFFGGQIGYNWHLPGSPWVIGVEADLAWADIGDSIVGVLPGPIVVTAASQIDYFGTARLRFGYAFDRVLLYLTGGLAWAHNELSVTAAAGPLFAGVASDNTHVGWTVGGGLEWALWNTWSMKIEYLYIDLSNENYFSALIPGGIPVDGQIHTAKIGVNYRFGIAYP